MERRRHFRGRPRAGRRVELRYRVSGAAAVTATTRDIGVGGAFIATEQPEPVGTALDLEIDVPGATGAIAITGEVRWVTMPGGDGEPREPGMGVKFGALDVDALLALSDFFAHIEGTGDGSVSAE